MKFKYIIVGLISISLCCCFSYMISENCSAKDRNYDITILDTSYEFLKSVGSGTQTTFEYYKINIVLHNSGPDVSENVTLSIEDPDDLVPVKQNYTFMPDETKTFVFGDNNNYMIQGTGDHLINVTVYVNESENILAYKQMIMNKYGTTPEDTSTPGFEFILFTISLMMLLVIFKRRR